jgi:hypothetical protein
MGQGRDMLHHMHYSSRTALLEAEFLRTQE